MKDYELRAIVLQKYYELRDRGFFQWIEIELDDQFPIKTWDALARICDQLGEHGLIDWRAVRGDDGKTAGGSGKITAFGVDVVEGTTQAPISISFDQRTVTITGSNNIIGDNNRLNLEKVNSEISQSNFTEAEKAEAKSVWEKVCNNKILNTIVGSIFGAATKHALETTHTK